MGTSALVGLSIGLSTGGLPARAADITWISADDIDWNNGTNWSTGTTPRSPDRAIFGAGTMTFVVIAAPSSIGTIEFTPTADSHFFSVTQNLTITGDGILNRSTNGQTFFVNRGVGLSFTGGTTTGTVDIVNLGNLSYTNASAGSGTITNDGAVDFYTGSTAGLAAITNNSGATINFNNDSKGGTAQITNAGFVNFGGTANAEGTTIVNDGVGSRTTFNDSSNAGNVTITNTSGFVVFNDNASAGNAVIKNDPTSSAFRTIQFNDNSTAGNATISTGSPSGPNAGISFFDNSNAGTATLTAGSRGSITFQDSSSAQQATLIANSGGSINFRLNSSGDRARLVANSGGTISISQLTTTGTTAGSIEGAGTLNLGAKTLTIGSNNLSTTFSGTIQGANGALIKVGTGALTLDGTNSYTGATTVNGGALMVMSSLTQTSHLTVNAGGMLGGTGTVASTTINGGTLAPGGASSTFTVSGALGFTAGSTYAVEVSPTNAGKTVVTGTASLAGTVQASFQPGSYVQRNYTILSATDLAGTRFGALATNNLPPNFAASLSYTTTDVLLNLMAALGAGTSLARNQQGVANTINGAFNDGGTLPPAFSNLFGMSGSNLSNALASLSGEAATGAPHGAFKLAGQFLDVMLDPFLDGRGDGDIVDGGRTAIGFAPERQSLPQDIALAHAAVTNTPPATLQTVAPRWSSWGGAFGGANKTSGDPLTAGSHDVSTRAGGVAAGLDHRIAPGTILGIALAGGGTSWALAQGLGGGKSDAVQAGVYGKTRSGPAYLAAALAFSQHWMSTDRVALGNPLGARFNARSVGGRIEGGWRFGVPAGGITPYAALQAQYIRTPGYSETGGGFALSYDARAATATRSEFGARFDHVAMASEDAVLTLRGRLAWAHDWVSDPSLTAVFQTLPGASFIVDGAAPATDLALVSAGAELRLANGVALLGKFDGEVAARSTTYAGTAAVRLSW